MTGVSQSRPSRPSKHHVEHSSTSADHAGSPEPSAFSKSSASPDIIDSTSPDSAAGPVSNGTTAPRRAPVPASST